MFISKECAPIVGANLRKMRFALGHSMKSMSELLGNDRNANKIKLYEMGKRVTPLHILIKAMEVTEIPMEDLYDIIFDINYKLPKMNKPYANASQDYGRFLSDKRLRNWEQ